MSNVNDSLIGLIANVIGVANDDIAMGMLPRGKDEAEFVAEKVIAAMATREPVVNVDGGDAAYWKQKFLDMQTQWEKIAFKNNEQPDDCPQWAKEEHPLYLAIMEAYDETDTEEAWGERLHNLLLPYMQPPKRELSGWNTLEVEPQGAYGIDISAPLVFRTVEMTSMHVHLRLGYYNRSDAVFYESGEKRPWKCHEVTHWHLLPESPISAKIEGDKS